MTYKFNDIKLDKGMYAESGKSFTQVLEALDPSENYRGTAYEGLDAYQRQLKRFDIKVKGADSDAVESFFSTSDSAVLFPEYVSRSVRAGMEERDILSSIAASVTNFDGLDYRSIYTDQSDVALEKVDEGASIPTVSVKASSSLVKLKKRGRMLVASYEAIRFQRIDLFSVMLRQVGSQIMRMHLTDAIDVIRNGDGADNDNAAPAYAVGDAAIGGTAGALGYGELLAFWNTFDPYTMNTLLVSPDVMLQLLKCTEFQNPLTGLNFQGTGELTNPLGAKLIRTSALPGGTLIGLDKNYALEMISAGDVTVEYDRLIDRQLERAAITSISGFAKLYREASAVLTLGAADGNG